MTFTAVSGRLLRGLGLAVERMVQSGLADGSLALAEIGKTMIRLEGRVFTTPVIFGGEGELNLLGVIALEEALLGVDPVGGCGWFR